MSIRQFLVGRSFDPETVALLAEAFEGACADLGVTDQTPQAHARVASEVIRLAGDHNAQHIRAAVVTMLKSRH